MINSYVSSSIWTFQVCPNILKCSRWVARMVRDLPQTQDLSFIILCLGFDLDRVLRTNNVEVRWQCLDQCWIYPTIRACLKLPRCMNLIQYWLPIIRFWTFLNFAKIYKEGWSGAWLNNYSFKFFSPLYKKTQVPFLGNNRPPEFLNHVNPVKE